MTRATTSEAGVEMPSTPKGMDLVHSANHNQNKKEGHTMKKFRFAAAVAIGVGSFGMFTSAGTALADGLQVSPPAVIDEDGFQNYDTSSYLATPSYPAAASYPGAAAWPGQSSHPCCSR